MNYRALTSNDYGMLCEWWSFWRFAAPPQHALSTSGIIVFEGDIPVCAGFLYGTNSSFCLIEFIVSNPNVKDKELRSNAMEYLINSLCDIGKQSGFYLVFSSLKNQNLINKYKDCGFTEGSNNCVELIKGI
jgi:hypothetical protein